MKSISMLFSSELYYPTENRKGTIMDQYSSKLGSFQAVNPQFGLEAPQQCPQRSEAANLASAIEDILLSLSEKASMLETVADIVAGAAPMAADVAKNPGEPHCFLARLNQIRDRLSVLDERFGNAGHRFDKAVG